MRELKRNILGTVLRKKVLYIIISLQVGVLLLTIIIICRFVTCISTQNPQTLRTFILTCSGDVKSGLICSLKCEVYRVPTQFWSLVFVLCSALQHKLVIFHDGKYVVLNRHISNKVTFKLRKTVKFSVVQPQFRRSPNNQRLVPKMQENSALNTFLA